MADIPEWITCPLKLITNHILWDSTEVKFYKWLRSVLFETIRVWSASPVSVLIPLILTSNKVKYRFSCSNCRMLVCSVQVCGEFYYFRHRFSTQGEKNSKCTLITPRKTFCVAAMSSSLCSGKLGWMLSFWAASSTFCPDTLNDSSKDDISISKTSSSVSLICLEVNICIHRKFLVKIQQLLQMFVYQILPGDHCCHVLSGFSHDLSLHLQLAK